MVVVQFLIALVAFTLAPRTNGECISCSQVPPQTEIDSLLALYSSTAGNHWLISWDVSTSNPCVGWYGVTCCRVENTCHVVELQLASNHLVGSIPAAIGNLTVLESLEFGSNKLQNTIPSSISTMAMLTELSLFDNELTGSIPSTIGDLRSLQALYLYSNALTGRIPSSIGNLTALKTLELNDNQLTGSIPSTIGDLRSLQTWFLNSNALTGRIPPSIGNLTAVTTLELHNNGLTGSIPSTIGDLTSLRTFYLYSNALTGRIPSSIGNLTALRTLELYSNGLTGSIPSTIEDMTSLQLLYLFLNTLTGRIPLSIGNWTAMISVDLGENQLTGPVPSAIGEMASLQTFEVFTNMLTGRIPSSIGNLASLKLLGLATNQLTGPIPSTIGEMTSLQILDLYSNALTGRIPLSIGNLTALRILELNENRLTGSIPSTIGKMTSLQTVYLYSNMLTGRIPSSIGNLTALRTLELYSNELTGSIPSIIGDLRSLQTFEVFTNALTGRIPPSIGNLTTMILLTLGDNQLTGPIPSSIGDMTSLQILDLYSNALTGRIPSSIGNLTALRTLDLDTNQLTGSIPLTISELASLQTIEVFTNALTGPIPFNGSGWTNVSYFEASSNFFTQAIPQVLPTSLVYFIVGDCLLSGMLSSVFDTAKLVSISVEGNMISGIVTRRIMSPVLQYLSVANNQIPSSPAIDELLEHPFVILDLSSNRLNASLPAAVWNTSVQQLLLNNNQLSGTFPDRGARECSMQYLSVAGNGLWGSLPIDLQQCANLTHFFASDMQLTGPVSGRFATQRWLQTVVVSSNSLTGPIGDLFAASSASGLILNAAYNQFTGTLPVASLQTGRYQSLILTSNCLSGTLPGDVLCANGNLTELILSGLHSAASCRYDVFPTLTKLGVYSSYVETNDIGGTVPSCVFDSLSQLTYVALSGNALTGALPEEVRLPDTLQGLDLSHNQLTGTIAAGIVAANLTLLDLSFNRLSGTISEQASEVYARNPAARVSLEVNELSGTLPLSWVEAVNIDVLDGNMFACEVGRIGQTANRPLHDSLQATYACGSSTTNVALVVALAAGVGAVLVLLWVRWRGQSATWGAWLSLCDEWEGVIRPWRLDALVLVVYLVGSMIVYAALTATTTVYAETYVWSVSLALQSGVAAGVVALVWLGLLLCASCWHTCSAMTKVSASASVSYGRLASVVLMVGTAHVLPVFVVNMVYVYTTTLGLSRSVQAVVVLLMSVFKASWNALVNVYMTVDIHGVGRLLSLADQEVLFARRLLLWCGLINLIVSPVATEALVSPNCFRYLFSQIQTNSYSIAGGTCYWVSYDALIVIGQETVAIPTQAIACVSFLELEQTYNNNATTSNMVVMGTTSNGEASTVDYQAGFAYNYQCSFSLLQAFVYVFVYKYVLSVLVLPLVWWVLKRLQTYAYIRYGLSSAWYRWATPCLPPIMKLLDSVEVDEDKKDGQAIESNRTRLVQWANVDQAKKCEMWLSLRMTGDLAVALSFGALFPLLGLLALMGIGSDVLQTLWMVHRLRAHIDRVGRRMKSIAAGSDKTNRPAMGDGASGERIDQLQLTEYHRVASEQLAALEKVVPSTVQSMTKDVLTVQCFAAVTWALTLYDIVGREEGSVTSLWILVVTLTMPWWMMGLGQAARFLWTTRELSSIDEGDKRKVELTENPLHEVSSRRSRSADV